MGQIVVGAAGDDDVGRAALGKGVYNEGAEEAGAAGDDNALFLPEGLAVGSIFFCHGFGPFFGIQCSMFSWLVGDVG